MITSRSVSVPLVLLGSALARPAHAQHQHGDAPGHKEPAAHQPHAAQPAEDKRVGDPYPFETCPISGEKLGSMGEPVVKLYDGREVRYCCDGCPDAFEANLPTSLAKLDEKIIKDQVRLYPLHTSVVTGKPLPENPHQFVDGNRLVLLGAESERAGFLKASKKYLADLDKAVVAAQGIHYPLTKCPVSGEELGGDMGKPVDLVVAGRLVRLCCPDCRPEVEKNPAKFLKIIDDTRKARGGAHEHK